MEKTELQNYIKALQIFSAYDAEINIGDYNVMVYFFGEDKDVSGAERALLKSYG